MSAGRTIRRATDADLPGLYGLAAADLAGWPRVTREGLPSPTVFGHVLWAGVDDHRVLADEKGAPISFTSVYDFDPANRIAWVEMCAFPQIEQLALSHLVQELVADGDLLNRVDVLLRERVDHVPPNFDLEAIVFEPVVRLPEGFYQERRYIDLVIDQATVQHMRP